jgi:hypothetical protein
MNILHVPRAPESVAKNHGMSVEELHEALQPMRQKLYDAREQRVRPGLDDKIVASWNGMMLTALSRGAQVLGEAKYAAAAEEAARFVLTDMRRDGRLLRTHRHGDSRVPAYLDDYACMVNGLVDVYETTFDAQWIAEARTLADAMIELFYDEEGGGFFYTAPDHTDVLVRMKPTYDGSEPSGNSMAVQALLRLARLTGEGNYDERAEKTLAFVSGNAAQMPRAYLRMLCALDFLIRDPREIAIAGPIDDGRVGQMLETVRRPYLPNKVVAQHDPSANGAGDAVPLLVEKDLVNGEPAAYVCENFACQQPITTPEDLADMLKV